MSNVIDLDKHRIEASGEQLEAAVRNRAKLVIIRYAYHAEYGLQFITEHYFVDRIDADGELVAHGDNSLDGSSHPRKGKHAKLLSDRRYRLLHTVSAVFAPSFAAQWTSDGLMRIEKYGLTTIDAWVRDILSSITEPATE